MSVNVYITNLGKYNEGYLIGKWISLPMDEDDINEVLLSIGVGPEPDKHGNYYEEYFLTDWEDSYGLEIGEYSNIYELSRKVEELEQYDEDEVEAMFEALGDYDEVIRMLESGDYSFWNGWSVEDVCREIAEEQISCFTYGGKVPDIFLNYFDYEAYQRDLECEGDFTETDSGVLQIYR